MPRRPAQASTVTIRFDDADTDEETPTVDVHVVDHDGEVIRTLTPDRAEIALDDELLERARRVVVAARGEGPGGRSALALRPDEIRRARDLGVLALPGPIWRDWLPWRRCVDATIERCLPRWAVLADLAVSLAPMVALGPLRASALADLHRPWWRCAPVCEGTVEVYRRRCCCRPPHLDLPVITEQPPFDWPVPDPGPWWERHSPIVPRPGPGPDPVPFEALDRLVTDGALDVAKVSGTVRSTMPRTSGRAASARADWREQLLRPWCRCSTPVKVADGFVGEGGRIHACWIEGRVPRPARCHDEYAFVVRQRIAGTTVTIYNGLGAGQWFDTDDEMRLVSFHPRAIGCRTGDFPVPVEGAFALLQDIGATESHRLRTPMPDGPDSVATPSSGAGLLDLDAGPDWACGGTLALRYHFSDVAGASMKALGARFFRVQWAAASTAGDPVGGWETLPVPAWKTWRVVGADIVPGNHALGPHSAGGHHDLYLIPFETGGALDAGEEWQDGQFHAQVPTTDLPAGSYLVRLEVFDAAGVRLEPAGGGFTFRRWDTETTTATVGHGALTHLIRTDNRPVVAELVDVEGPGAGAGDCKFFVGSAADSVTVRYRAYHPEPGTPSFLRSYSLGVYRGVSGTPATAPLTSSVEVGEGGPAAAYTVTLGDLLDGEDRCSFSLALHASARIHDGSGPLTHLDRSDIAAFAVQAV